MAVNDIKRMEELNELLAKAADAYYNTGVEIMSDKQYDDLYDELEALEKRIAAINKSTDSSDTESDEG